MWPIDTCPCSMVSVCVCFSVCLHGCALAQTWRTIDGYGNVGICQITLTTSYYFMLAFRTEFYSGLSIWGVCKNRRLRFNFCWPLRAFINYIYLLTFIRKIIIIIYIYIFTMFSALHLSTLLLAITYVTTTQVKCTCTYVKVLNKW